MSGSIRPLQGFHSGNAFKLESIEIRLKLSSLLSDRVILEEIAVDCPELTYEINGTTNNIQTILDNIALHTYKPGKESLDSTDVAEEVEGRTVQVNRLVLTGGKVNLGTTLVKGKVLTLPLPEIILNDIGKEKEKSFSVVFEEVVAAVNENISSVISDSSMLLDHGLLFARQGVTAVDRTVQKASTDLRSFFGRYRTFGNKPDADTPLEM